MLLLVPSQCGSEWEHMNVGNTAAVQPLSPAAVITAVCAHLPEQENETMRYSSVFILSPFLQNPIVDFFPIL